MFFNQCLAINYKFSKYKYIYPEYVSFGDTYMFYYQYLELRKKESKNYFIWGD